LPQHNGFYFLFHCFSVSPSQKTLRNPFSLNKMHNFGISHCSHSTTPTVFTFFKLRNVLGNAKLKQQRYFQFHQKPREREGSGSRSGGGAALDSGEGFGPRRVHRLRHPSHSRAQSGSHLVKTVKKFSSPKAKRRRMVSHTRYSLQSTVFSVSPLRLVLTFYVPLHFQVSKTPPCASRWMIYFRTEETKLRMKLSSKFRTRCGASFLSSTVTFTPSILSFHTGIALETLETFCFLSCLKRAWLRCLFNDCFLL